MLTSDPCLVCGGPGAQAFGLCAACDAQAAADLAADMERWRAEREAEREREQEERGRRELLALAEILAGVLGDPGENGGEE